VNLSTGPTNEAGQTLSFNVTANSNPTLFASAPAIASNEDLTYTPGHWRCRFGERQAECHRRRQHREWMGDR
jgi:hypothetical protein